jgi:cyclic pyranopterin phosphate synthase
MGQLPERGADPQTAREPLTDAQGRRISYLRVSLTDRCNFRCGYCSATKLEDADRLLTREELARLVAVLAAVGVRRVRLTGGEPTLRKEVVEIARDVAQTPGIEEVAISTNGHRMGELAEPLRAAGVRAVNLSLDTLSQATLERISGPAARLDQVLEGLDAAARAGFESLKVNTVVLGGVNDGELGDLVRLAWSHGATPRFIELMPFASPTSEARPVPTARVKELLAEQGIPLVNEPGAKLGWGPALYLHDEASARRVGFIGAMTENFCAACNRARVTSTGEFQACLGGAARAPLGELLRDGAPASEIEARVRAALAAKAPRHHMEDEGIVLLPMRGIGG